MEAGADDFLEKPLDPDVLKLRLMTAERITSLYARLHTQQLELERLNKELYRDGRRCALTGIPNRLQFDEDLNTQMALTERHGKPFCLALFDIDFFKPYNDTCGHVAGDDVLKQVAQALQRAARQSDRVYRYGGEEFVAIFVFGEIDGGFLAADRMRNAVEQLAIPHPGRTDGKGITISGGVMCYRGDPKSCLLYTSPSPRD